MVVDAGLGRPIERPPGLRRLGPDDRQTLQASGIMEASNGFGFHLPLSPPNARCTICWKPLPAPPVTPLFSPGVGIGGLWRYPWRRIIGNQDRDDRLGGKPRRTPMPCPKLSHRVFLRGRVIAPALLLLASPAILAAGPSAAQGGFSRFGEGCHDQRGRYRHAVGQRRAHHLDS